MNAVNAVENVIKTSHETFMDTTTTTSNNNNNNNNNDDSNKDFVEIDAAEAESTIARLVADNTSMEEKLVLKNKEILELKELNDKLQIQIQTNRTTSNDQLQLDYKQTLQTIKQKSIEIETLKKDLENEIISSNNRFSDMIIAEQDKCKQQIEFQEKENLKLVRQLKDANAAIVHLENIANTNANNMTTSNNNNNNTNDKNTTTNNTNEIMTLKQEYDNLQLQYDSLANTYQLQTQQLELITNELNQSKSYIQEYEKLFKETEEIIWKSKAEQTELLHYKDFQNDIIEKLKVQEQSLIQQIEILKTNNDNNDNNNNSYNELMTLRESDLQIIKQLESQQNEFVQQIESLKAIQTEYITKQDSDNIIIEKLQSSELLLNQQLQTLQNKYDTLQYSYDELIIIKNKDVELIDSLKLQITTLSSTATAVATNSNHNNINTNNTTNNSTVDTTKSRIKLIDIYNKLEKLLSKSIDITPASPLDEIPSLSEKSSEELITGYIVPQIKTIAKDYMKIKKEYDEVKHVVTNQQIESESQKKQIQELMELKEQLLIEKQAYITQQESYITQQEKLTIEGNQQLLRVSHLEENLLTERQVAKIIIYYCVCLSNCVME